LGLGDLHRELGDLAAATRYLAHSEALGEPAGLPDWPYRFRLAQSRLELAQGEPDNALALLEAAERFYFRSPMPEVRPLAALKARLWLALNRLPEAQRWAQEQKLSVDDDLSYLREFEHITLARLLIARYKNDQTEQRFIEQANGLLDRLLEAAKAGQRMGSTIEILLLQALARQAQDDIPAALAPLKRALTLAEPEGYVRLFVDEGLPMGALLREAAARGIAPDYTGRLLAAFPNLAAGPTPQSKIQNPNLEMVEPLSERELEVLRLVAQGLANREISERLFLALDTVKGHNRRIFSKLQVKRRTEAVARAQELGLL